MNGHSVDQLASIAEMNKSFYQDLPAARAIRLLVLEPGLLTDDIECHLIVVKDLRYNPEYEALSYCWGSAARRADVRCGERDARFTVSENLFAALKRLRREDKSRVLWIDAMCINQHDLYERSKQVSLMRSIYAHATGVIVWLGEVEQIFGPTIQLMRDIQHSLLAIEPRIGCEGRCTDEWLLLPTDEKRRRVQQWTRPSGFLEVNDSSWETLMHFFELPWFYRVWVIQEIQSSSTAYVLCGGQKISWALVSLMASWLRASSYGLQIRATSQYRENDNQGAFMGAEQLYFMGIRHLVTPQEAPFLRLLDRAQNFQSSDPRDKIYALLTHAATRLGGTEDDPMQERAPLDDRDLSGTHHLNIQADYGRSVLELLRMVAIRSITEYQTLETLNYAWKLRRELLSHRDMLSPYSSPAFKEGYPSWVPQWDAVISNRRNHFRAYIYDACSGYKPSLRNGQLPEQIFLQGIAVDVVSETNVTLSTADLASGDLSRERHRSTGLEDLVDFSILMAADVTEFYDGVRLGPEGVRQRASSNLEKQFANFAAWSMDALNGKATSKFISSMNVTCHVCNRRLEKSKEVFDQIPTSHNCHLCHMGAFDICTECYTRGKHCLSKEHTLAERNLQGFWFEYDSITFRRLSDVAQSGKANEFGIVQAADRRAVFRTHQGFLGICPLVVIPGDVVVVLLGGRSPFILRKVADHYVLVADCYVHGMMDGQVIQMWQSGAYTLEEFVLR